MLMNWRNHSAHNFRPWARIWALYKAWFSEEINTQIRVPWMWEVWCRSLVRGCGVRVGVRPDLLQHLQHILFEPKYVFYPEIGKKGSDGIWLGVFKKPTLAAQWRRIGGPGEGEGRLVWSRLWDWSKVEVPGVGGNTGDKKSGQIQERCRRLNPVCGSLIL